jgi:hypothetical protein
LTNVCCHRSRADRSARNAHRALSALSPLSRRPCRPAQVQSVASTSTTVNRLNGSTPSSARDALVEHLLSLEYSVPAILVSYTRSAPASVGRGFPQSSD